MCQVRFTVLVYRNLMRYLLRYTINSFNVVVRNCIFMQNKNSLQMIISNVFVFNVFVYVRKYRKLSFYMKCLLYSINNYCISDLKEGLK